MSADSKPGSHGPAGCGGDIPAWAERFVLFLDDGFVVPGTSFRVGFDAILGLVPVAGDFVTTASSLALLWLAYQRGAPKAVFGRMLVNIGIDALTGAVPFLGDVFDVVFKANRRNLELLRRYDRDPVRANRIDIAFLLTILATVLALMTIPLVLAIAIVRWMFG